jgi:tetratricopeptide (TPR) repeat protein
MVNRGSWWVLLFAAAGCAAAQAPDREPQPPHPVYERILGSAIAAPDVILYLNPRIAERYFDSTARDDGFPRVVAAFERMGARRGEAAARLNWGAVLWNLDETERAYREMTSALDLFNRIGDVEGIAHAHEWIGYALEESGAVEPAGDHLAIAYQLFRKLGNEGAAQRVAGYGE